MSWIKPNFLWMMFRSGWAEKEGQEHILAVRISRVFFDEILAASVATTFRASGFSDPAEWKLAGQSDVRLQWDPDHDPSGNSVDRRAVQLGLRGQTMRRYGSEEVISITDITPLVAEQRGNSKHPYENLLVPTETVYIPPAQIAQHINLDSLD